MLQKWWKKTLWQHICQKTLQQVPKSIVRQDSNDLLESLGWFLNNPPQTHFFSKIWMRYDALHFHLYVKTLNMNTLSLFRQGPGTWLAIVEVHFRCCHHEWICHVVTCSPAHCAIAAEALLLAKGFGADGPIRVPSLDLLEPGSCETATAKTFLYWAVSLSLVAGVISGRCAKACCESGRKAKEVEVTRLSAMARVLEYVLHTLSQTHQFESWSWNFWTSLSYWYKGMTYDILLYRGLKCILLRL